MAKSNKTAPAQESSALDLRSIAYELRSNDQVKATVEKLRPKAENGKRKGAQKSSDDDYVEKKGFSIPAKALFTAYPALQVFDPELPLFRAYPLGEKTVGVQSLLLGVAYLPRQSLSDSLQVEMKLYNTRLEPLEGFEVVRHTIGMGMNASAVIRKDGQEFIISMLISDAYQEEVISKKISEAMRKGVSYQGEVEAEGNPPIEALGTLPQKEQLLFNLKEGMKYRVTAISGLSRKYQSDLFDLVDAEGNQYPKVISNSALVKLVERHGMKAEFMIDSKEALTPSSNLQALLKKVVLKDCSPDAVALSLSPDDFMIA